MFQLYKTMVTKLKLRSDPVTVTRSASVEEVINIHFQLWISCLFSVLNPLLHLRKKKKKNPSFHLLCSAYSYPTSVLPICLFLSCCSSTKSHKISLGSATSLTWSALPLQQARTLQVTQVLGFHQSGKQPCYSFLTSPCIQFLMTGFRYTF